jgi:hypothetical protein
MFLSNVCWPSTKSSVISEGKYIHNHLCENLNSDLRFDEFLLTPGHRHCVLVDDDELRIKFSNDVKNICLKDVIKYTTNNK